MNWFYDSEKIIENFQNAKFSGVNSLWTLIIIMTLSQSLPVQIINPRKLIKKRNLKTDVQRLLLPLHYLFIGAFSNGVSSPWRPITFGLKAMRKIVFNQTRINCLPIITLDLRLEMQS